MGVPLTISTNDPGTVLKKDEREAVNEAASSRSPWV